MSKKQPIWAPPRTLAPYYMKHTASISHWIIRAYQIEIAETAPAYANVPIHNNILIRFDSIEMFGP